VERTYVIVAVLQRRRHKSHRVCLHRALSAGPPSSVPVVPLVCRTEDGRLACRVWFACSGARKKENERKMEEMHSIECCLLFVQFLFPSLFSFPSAALFFGWPVALLLPSLALAAAACYLCSARPPRPATPFPSFLPTPLGPSGIHGRSCARTVAADVAWRTRTQAWTVRCRRRGLWRRRRGVDRRLSGVVGGTRGGSEHQCRGP
jgi:hypothetical protein